MEPDNTSDVQPVGSTLKTILTASPDQRRYKEFKKSGALKVFMPTWTLNELLTVGADVREKSVDRALKELNTPEKIEDRFKRFGGIFRYVIADYAHTVSDAESAQLVAMDSVRSSLLYVARDNLERRDEAKDNVSHFMLQYDVFYGDNTPEGKKQFESFMMRSASEYVSNKCFSMLTDSEIRNALVELRKMFAGQQHRFETFEQVVYWLLIRAKNCQWKKCSFSDGC